MYEKFGPKWHRRIHKKGIWNHFQCPGRSRSSPAGSASRPSRLAEPGRPGLAGLAAWPRLAGRWAALREGKEARAQEGEVRTGQEEPPHSYHRRWVI